MTRIFHLRKAGFTLIELLVVISIISLLSSVMLTSLAEARRNARNSYTIQTIRQYINAIELAKERPLARHPTRSLFCLGKPLPNNGVCFQNIFAGDYFNDYIDDYLPGPPTPNPNQTDSDLSPGSGVTILDQDGDGFIDRILLHWTMERDGDGCLISDAIKRNSGTSSYFCELVITL